ncbi:hypothetical protein HPULCUR_005788 [Helicostylum pulchrum]|uniref:Uncharacterized protein n=1 Tax=Helicostylum pulchrum TaxID=562976 RepID=A0ABP9Y1C4_9FUNG
MLLSRDILVNRKGDIRVFIEDKFHSGSIYSRSKGISFEMIHSYICLLKDVIEEEDVVEEKAGKSVCQVDNVIGDYDVWNHVDKDDKVTGEQVGDYDII